MRPRRRDAVVMATRESHAVAATRLRHFGRDRDSIHVTRRYINDENMQVAVVERVSTAAKGLCMWLHAMNVYHKVAKEVGPKREKVAQLTAQLEAANEELQAKRDNLAAVVAKVEQLQKTCDETVAEKQRLLDAQAQTVLTQRLSLSMTRS